MTTQQLTARRNAALARSVEDVGRVEQFTATDYVVLSSTERHRQYIVVADGGTYSCNCPAGQQGVPCRHSAAVYRLRTGLGRARIQVRG